MEELDNPVWSSLTGTHAHLAVGGPRALRYGPGFSPFAAVADPTDPDHLAGLAAIVEPGEQVVLVTAAPLEAPPGWQVTFAGPGHQLRATNVDAASSSRAELLTEHDVEAMVALVAVATPGPFTERTIELGTYVGVFEGDHLVAMAGQRFAAGGAREVSAVCTHPEWTGRGLARELVRHLVALDRDAGATAFLHVAEHNVRAHAIYADLGFTERRRILFSGLTRDDG